MYRIEVSPGEETVFRTIEELATGIRNGVITSRARIHHGASAKWLPIEFHPHYKKAVELAAHPPSAVEQSHPTPTPAPPKRRSVPTTIFEPAPIVEPPPPAVVRPAPSPATSSEPEFVLPRISYPEVPREEPQTEPQPLFKSRRRMGRRPLMLAAAVMVVAVGARFMLAAAPPIEEPDLPTTTLGSSPAPVAEPKPAPRQPAPKPVVKPAPKPVVKPAPAPAPEPAPAPPPSRPEPLKPTVPGPAFAPALPSTSMPAKAVAKPAVPGGKVTGRADSTPPAAPAIEPAPAQIDLALPGALPSTDSISVISKSADSNAIRRILKAVTGTKAQPTKAGTR